MDEEQVIESILRRYRRALVVGLSADPDRPSHGVASYLGRHGYRVVPVNPNLSASALRLFGEPAYPDLARVPGDLLEPSGKLGLVVVFRRPEHVPAVADQALARGVEAFWMQQGIYHAGSAARLRAAGALVVEGRCLAVEHSLHRRRLALP